MVAAVLLLELPVRIVYFYSSIGSIPALVGTIMAIILPLWFYNQRKIWVFVVIVIILTLICTIGLEKWDEVYWMYRGSEVEKLKREALGGM
jgi:ABC-type xylose transport system permease subunit